MKAEKILVTAAIAAVILRYYHMPLSAQLLILSMGALAILYFGIGNKIFKTGDVIEGNSMLSKASRFVFSLVPMGILFKLLYWPNSSMFLMISMIGGIIILTATLLEKSKANDEMKAGYTVPLRRAFILTALSLCLYFTPTATLIKIQYRDDPELAKLKTYRFVENPTKEDYEKRLADYNQKKDSLEHLNKK